LCGFGHVAWWWPEPLGVATNVSHLLWGTATAAAAAVRRVSMTVFATVPLVSGKMSAPDTE
jgi:hypothetical protein